MDDFPNMTSRIKKLITILRTPYYRQAFFRHQVAAAVEQLERALAGRGHQVDYSYRLTTQLIQCFKRHPELENFTEEAISLPKPFARYNYMRRWRDESAHGRKVAQKVRDFRPDVVLSANAPLDAQKLILSDSREVGAKFIFWMQETIGWQLKARCSPVSLYRRFHR